MDYDDSYLVFTEDEVLQAEVEASDESAESGPLSHSSCSELLDLQTVENCVEPSTSDEKFEKATEIIDNRIQKDETLNDSDSIVENEIISFTIEKKTFLNSHRSVLSSDNQLLYFEPIGYAEILQPVQTAEAVGEFVTEKTQESSVSVMSDIVTAEDCQEESVGLDESKLGAEMSSLETEQPRDILNEQEGDNFNVEAQSYVDEPDEDTNSTNDDDQPQNETIDVVDLPGSLTEIESTLVDIHHDYVHVEHLTNSELDMETEKEFQLSDSEHQPDQLDETVPESVLQINHIITDTELTEHNSFHVKDQSGYKFAEEINEMVKITTERDFQVEKQTEPTSAVDTEIENKSQVQVPEVNPDYDYVQGSTCNPKIENGIDDTESEPQFEVKVEDNSMEVGEETRPQSVVVGSENNVQIGDASVLVEPENESKPKRKRKKRRLRFSIPRRTVAATRTRVASKVEPADSSIVQTETQKNVEETVLDVDRLDVKDKMKPKRKFSNTVELKVIPARKAKEDVKSYSEVKPKTKRIPLTVGVVSVNHEEGAVRKPVRKSQRTVQKSESEEVDINPDIVKAGNVDGQKLKTIGKQQQLIQKRVVKLKKEPAAKQEQDEAETNLLDRDTRDYVIQRCSETIPKSDVHFNMNEVELLYSIGRFVQDRYLSSVENGEDSIFKITLLDGEKVLRRFDLRTCLDEKVYMGTGNVQIIEKMDAQFYKRYLPVHAIMICKDPQMIRVYGTESQLPFLYEMAQTEDLFLSFQNFIQICIFEIRSPGFIDRLKQAVSEPSEQRKHFLHHWNNLTVVSQNRMSGIRPGSLEIEDMLKMYPIFHSSHRALYGRTDACAMCKNAHLKPYKISLLGNTYNSINFSDNPAEMSSKKTVLYLCHPCLRRCALFQDLHHYQKKLFNQTKELTMRVLKDDDKGSPIKQIEAVMNYNDWIRENFVEFQVLLADAKKQSEDLCKVEPAVDCNVKGVKTYSKKFATRNRVSPREH